jgi:hypothetical protein
MEMRDSAGNAGNFGGSDRTNAYLGGRARTSRFAAPAPDVEPVELAEDEFVPHPDSPGSCTIECSWVGAEALMDAAGTRKP